MPTPTENLWQAMKEKKYDEVIALVKANPELINAVDKGYSLMKEALIGKKPLDFIKFIVTHPQLNLHYQDPNSGESNVDAIISKRRIDILEMLINNPEILFNGDKLTYESIKDALGTAIRAFNRAQKKNSDPKSVEDEKTRVETLEKMLPLICEPTIRYAIIKDDADILTRLKQAGVDLYQPLSDGTVPVRLLTEQNKNVGPFFRKLAGERAAERGDIVINNPNCLFEYRQAELKLKQLEADFAKKQSEIMARTAAKAAGYLEQAQQALR